MKSGIKSIIVLSVFLWPGAASPARADGGFPRLRKHEGSYRIAVFTAPTPMRAGPVDISVFVQDAATGKHLPEAKVTVYLTFPGQVGPTIQYPATTAAATNKLFQAAQFDLPAPGLWKVEIQVAGWDSLAKVKFTMEAAEALPVWLTLWPWFTWPVLVILVFAIHQWMVTRNSPVSCSKSNGTTQLRR